MAGSGGSSSDVSSDNDLELQDHRHHLLFEGIVAYFVEPGINPRRLEIWKRKVAEMGGKLEGHLSQSITHIFAVDTKNLLDRINPVKLEKLKRMKVVFLRCDWIQESLKTGALLGTESYKLALTAESSHTSATEQSNLEALQYCTQKVVLTQKDHSDQVQSPTDEKVNKWMSLIQEGAKLGAIGSKKSKVSGYGPEDGSSFIHQNLDFSHDSDKVEGSDTFSGRASASNKQEQLGLQTVPHVYAPPDLNKDITTPFEELKNIYTDAIGDDRRSFSYYKALTVLEKVPFKITSADEVKGLPTIGKSMHDHIHEILTTGKLLKLENFKNDEMVRTITLFGSVWGIGPATARKLYEKGHKTLEDLKNEPSLTSAQRIGLLYHHDIIKKIPREEAREMEAIVQKTTQAIQPKTVVVCGGSYRRGKAFSGDMDMVITHPNGHSHKGLLRSLVQRLKEMNFLTEDLLVSVDHASEGSVEGVDTYFGLCKYPGRQQRHRIDFKIDLKELCWQILEHRFESMETLCRCILQHSILSAL
ncbi:hypothetical protein O6H91_05G075100 [Diphasiastrum complanatum]|uniref:Uncharacterized protein n=1 Tax=Diphasiastrum complanatum TaxID=34168 RepID=A0ACC2DPW2_DIPCM|nr:hypothetical protein O6H91_05G075100 [Diphasiastrum complanatum]